MARMSALKDRLRADLTTSMKARDEVRSSTLRMVLTAITNAEVAGKTQRELSDDDIVSVLSSEAKKRREAATAFEDAGRTEMANKEQAEAAVIADYLPEQLSAEEVAALVTAAVEQTGAAGRMSQPSWRRTSAATAPPSARPLTCGWTRPITRPMALGPSPAAPACSTAARTMSATSSAESCSGR